MRVTIDVDLPIKVEHFPANGTDGPNCYASITSMKGMGESGMTSKEALDELMLSLRVKLAYDWGVELESIEIVR